MNSWENLAVKQQSVFRTGNMTKSFRQLEKRILIQNHRLLMFKPSKYLGYPQLHPFQKLLMMAKLLAGCLGLPMGKALH